MVIIPEYQKRHIAVSPVERHQLEEAKKDYEKQAGEGDWGTFLGVATTIGLAALGIYALAKVSQRNATTWDVTCPNPNCQATFPLVAQSPPRLAQVTCPSCNAELIVDLGYIRDRLQPSVDGHSPLSRLGTTIAISCQHCERQMEVQVVAGPSPEGVSYVQCPFCGGVATYGVGQAKRRKR